MSDELKPCPFCGGEATVEKCLITNKCWILDHTDCDINIALVFKEKERAITAWNTRPGNKEALEALDEWAEDGSPILYSVAEIRKALGGEDK